MKILITIILLFFMTCCIDSNHIDKYNQQILADEYKGVIKERFFYRLNQLKIEIQDKKIITVGFLSHDLDSLASIGDSIFKHKDSNWCTLKKINGSSYFIKYMYAKDFPY